MLECFIAERDKFSLEESERVRARGGAVTSSASDYIAILKIFNVPIEENSFLLSGAYLTGCIAGATDSLLTLGARSVTVDLTRCRDVSEVIQGRELYTPLKRRGVLFENLYRRDLEGSRLFFITVGTSITPQSITPQG